MGITLEEHRATVPAFVIELRFESSRPVVRIDATTEGELDRLVDWVEANPGLGSLLEEALDLAEREGAP